MVGDTECDERVAALVAAAREALVNAARHAGVQTVSLYAEVESRRAERLRPRPRRRFRPVRCGGVAARRPRVDHRTDAAARRASAEIRSAPGEGTEVRLTLPASRDSVVRSRRRKAAGRQCDDRVEPAASRSTDGRLGQASTRVPGRRPCDVPRRCARRAGRARGRGGRGQHGGRGGQPDRRDRARRGAARRAHARRRRPRGAGRDAAHATRRSGSWRCPCRTRPRT